MKSPTGPCATEEEAATACWSGWCILVLCTNGNSFRYRNQEQLTSYEEDSVKVGQMYTSFTILLITDSCSSHKHMVISMIYHVVHHDHDHDLLLLLLLLLL